MKETDLSNWKRREHFAFFHRMDYPHFNVCFDIDITEFMRVIKEKNLPFYFSMIYLSTLSANLVEEFKYRIRDGKVFLHDSLTPSFTYMDGKNSEDDLFKMITVEMSGNINDFTQDASSKSKSQKEYFIVSDFMNRDDFIYYTSLPWISFTHLSHTINFNKNDSVPRLSWGKYYERDSRIYLPYSVQVNHALVDGIHIGRFKDALEKQLNSFN